MSANLAQVGLLHRVVPGQARHFLQTACYSGCGHVVGLQVERVARQQIAALACLGVLDRRQKVVDGDDHLMGVNDLLIIRPQHLDVEPGHAACRQKEGQNQGQSCSGPGFGLRARGRATEQHHQQSDLG
ncbi:hypothetical protein D3C86_971220 [compost metagenome]